MNLLKKPDTPYDKSKEYLDRQQKIDYLLVLASLLSAPGTGEELGKLVNKKAVSIIEDYK